MVIIICNIAGRGIKGKLNNLMVQLRKNCNHPDLLQSAFDGSSIPFATMLVILQSNHSVQLHLLPFFFFSWLTGFYPPVEQIIEQCGKFRLLDKLLARLFDRKHKVC